MKKTSSYSSILGTSAAPNRAQSFWLRGIICAGILLFTCYCSNAQSWIWGQGSSVSSESDTYGAYIGTDQNGNVYVTGAYANSITFGSHTITDASDEMFLVKYDQNGNVVWVRQPVAGPATSSETFGIAVDKSGNIYVTGYFGANSLTFGTYTLPGGNGFLVKYDPNGNVLWALCPPGQGMAVTTDKYNCVYVSAGYYTIAKYDSNGHMIRQFRIPGSSLGVNTMCTDNNANLYLGGGFSGSGEIIGPDTLTDLSSVPDPGVIKCDSGGNFIWASQASNFKKSDSTNGAYLNGIAADNTGACYVTGYFTGIFNYGKYRLVAPDTALPTIFFAKYNLAGHLEWIKQSQNPNWTACVACSDAYDNIYVAGTGVGDTLEISGTKIAKTGGGSSLTSAFLAKFDTAGNVECGSILNGGGTVFKIGDQIIGLASNPSGSNVYMGGVLGSSPVYTATDTLVNSGPASPYVVRWRNCGSDEGINEAAAPNNSVLVYPNPNNGRFTIELEGISERSTVEIYNVLGEKVYSCTLNMQQSAHSINISGQAQGMYLYRVISENGNCLGEGKVIIEN